LVYFSSTLILLQFYSTSTLVRLRGGCELLAHVPDRRKRWRGSSDAGAIRLFRPEFCDRAPPLPMKFPSCAIGQFITIHLAAL